MVFKITSENIYGRGPAFIVNIVVAYIYVAAALVLIIAKRKSLSKGELFPYLLVPLIPLVIGLFEVVVKVPVSLTWAATAVVWLEIQTFILNSKTNTDHLTGLNNRLALDSYIKKQISDSQVTLKSFGIIMLDLDGFKKVNDIYGHGEGDKALKAASDILSTCCAGRHFISRYGGDEFTVVIKDCTEDMLNGILLKIEDNRVKHNKALNKPYELIFSIGASIFEQKEITDIHTMFRHVDRIMYENKKAKKRVDQE